MRKHFLWTICALLGLSVSIISLGFANSAKSDSTLRTNSEKRAPNSSAKVLFFHYVDDIYESASLAQAGLDSAVFQKAVVGYYNLKVANKLPANSDILTVVDFNKPSTTKRMWIIDLQNRKLLLNTWVAHGQGSGNDMANAFSNNEESHPQSR